MMLFNKFLKKKIQFEVDLYSLNKGESTPFLLDGQLSINKNEIYVSNSSKKCTFFEENIFDFKYHEIDMCQFKYLCKDIVEEYGFVFSDAKGMYYFYKYIMYKYISGNIILTKNIDIYKYIDLKKVLYKKNYIGALIFNDKKCEHLFVIIKTKENENVSCGVENNEKKEDNYLDCEKFYKEINIDNIKELYKRNRIFLMHILNSFNDIYLSDITIGIYAKKYLFKNCFKYIEYKCLYEDGEKYKKFFVKGEKNKENSQKKNISNDSLENDAKEPEIVSGKDKNLYDKVVIVNEDKLNEMNKNVDIKNEENKKNDIINEKKEVSEMFTFDQKLLIIIDSDEILINNIKNIIIYRMDYNNDVLNIKKHYEQLQTKTSIDNQNEKIEDKIESDSDIEVEVNNLSFESESEIDSNENMKYKYINANNKFSFALRQNLFPTNKKKFMQRIEKREDDVIDYNKISNDLNIYKFDEYGKEKKIYNSNDKIFHYNNEKFIPRNFEINHGGDQILFLDEQNQNNLFMMDVNAEKIVKKWNTEYIPIYKLMKKEENIYCGFNKNSLYYIDTRTSKCVNNMLQYKTGSDIEHASIDNDGHIIVTTSDGNLKYFDGHLNSNNIIKKSKNVIFCSNNIKHITLSQNGKFSVITCEKNVIICSNYIEDKYLFEKVIKITDRQKQKKILLQLNYEDVFAYELGNYNFIKSNINHDNTYIFTFAKHFYVIWNIKNALNNEISYVIKKVTSNISDITFYNVNDIQGILLATEDKLTSKKIINNNK